MDDQIKNNIPDHRNPPPPPVKSRTDLDLVRLLLKQVEQHGVETGLCKVIWNMYKEKLITPNEESILEDIISQHRPENYYQRLSDNGYYFRPGLAEPRIKLLKQIIEFYEN